MMMLLERSKHDEDGVARVYVEQLYFFFVDLEKDYTLLLPLCAILPVLDYHFNVNNKLYN